MKKITLPFQKKSIELKSKSIENVIFNITKNSKTYAARIITYNGSVLISGATVNKMPVPLIFKHNDTEAVYNDIISDVFSMINYPILVNWGSSSDRLCLEFENFNSHEVGVDIIIYEKPKNVNIPFPCIIDEEATDDSLQ